MFKRSLKSKVWISFCSLVILVGVIIVTTAVSFSAGVWVVMLSAVAYSLGEELAAAPRSISVETLLWVAQLEEDLAAESIQKAQVAKKNQDKSQELQHAAVATSQFTLARALHVVIDSASSGNETAT